MRFPDYFINKLIHIILYIVVYMNKAIYFGYHPFAFT